MTPLYLDNSATTPMLPEVWEAMQAVARGRPGNPASSHSFGRQARRPLEDARERIALLLDAHPDEVIFTSGATEANNLAIFGLVQPAPGAIVTSAIEHPCVLEPARHLAGSGYRHLLLPVTRAGSVDLERVHFPEDTRLVSVMLANHETGALQPVQELAGPVPSGVPFHCDAAAAAGKVPVSFRALNVDALTISAHKFHGPPGIGALLVRRPGRLRPLLWGGHQQRGKRPGTEPVMLAVGMAAALSWCCERMNENLGRLERWRSLFLDELRSGAAPIVVNGPERGGVPHVTNVAFPGCKSDVLMMNLDLAGLACSAGSACSSGSLLVSHVLKEMQLGPAILESSLRFSFSCLADEEDIRQAARYITCCVNRLRQHVASAT